MELERSKEIANEILFGERTVLHLDGDSLDSIRSHIDWFVSHSRGNESITGVCLYLYGRPHYHQDGAWDKIGQVVGNLQALKRIHILTRVHYDVNDEHDEVIPNSEILACILSHVRQKITLDVTDITVWDAEEFRLFVQAIHGHTSVTGIEVESRQPLARTLFNALARALPMNSTLQDLSLKVTQSGGHPVEHVDWTLIFLALGKNTGLKTLKLDVRNSMEESAQR
jgi:hypothetical protein